MDLTLKHMKTSPSCSHIYIFLTCGQGTPGKQKEKNMIKNVSVVDQDKIEDLEKIKTLIDHL